MPNPAPSEKNTILHKKNKAVPEGFIRRTGEAEVLHGNGEAGTQARTAPAKSPPDEAVYF